MKRGDVWFVELPPVASGREQTGRRPAIVVQDAVAGQRLPTVLVVPLTSQTSALRFPGTAEILASERNGLSVTSVALVFQLRAVDRTRLTSQVGVLQESDLAAILSALNLLTGEREE